MKVTTRDLFNYNNPACKYQTFLKRCGLVEGVAVPEEDNYASTLEAKRQGTLAGEQVQHNRSDDEVDCGEG